ncbi:MAG: hypothetical protein ACRD98_07095 [Nitrososphaera sp.]
MYNLIHQSMSTQVISTALLAFGLTVSPIVSAEEVNVKVNTGVVIVPVGPPDIEFISKTISTAGPRTLVIHYFAECQVPRGHIEYDIVVNKGILAITSKQVPPTHDTLSALCSSSDPIESSLRAVSVGAVVACTVAKADNYTVRVRGHVVGPGAIDPGRVDDQSLVIEEHAFSRDVDIPECVVNLPEDVAGG